MQEPLGTARDDEKIVLSIVLPCFRERANLELLVPSILQEFRDVPHEVIVVDDGSADGTVELMAKFAEQYGNVRLIERDRLRGIGSALREGYDSARGEFILSSDADLSFSVDDMSRLLREARQGFDLVLGYKLFYRPMTKSSRGTEAFARLSFITSEFGNLVVAATTGVFGIRNFNTNFRILRRDLWQRVETREDRRFDGFARLTRQEILALPPSRHLRPGRRTVIGSFGPLDVNYAYYPNWIASDRIVLLTPRMAAEAVCGAPDSSASLLMLRRAVCPPAPIR